MRPLVAAGLLFVVAISSMGCKRKPKSEPYVYKPTPVAAYSDSSLATICKNKDGNKFDGNPAYAKSKDASKPSPVAFFRKYVDDKADDFEKLNIAAFKDTAIETRAAETQLVGCLESSKVPDKEPGYCNYYGGTVKIYEMKHKLRVFEVKTGKQVLEDEFVIDHRTARCESSRRFSTNSTSIYEGLDVTPKLASEILPLEPDGLKLAPVKATALDDVCAGGAVPQAEPYLAGTTTRIHMTYFPEFGRPDTREEAPTGMPAFDDNKQDASSYGLVACITGQPKKKKRDCDYTNFKSLTLWDGEFEVQMREARTGKVVETKSFKGTAAGGCPSFHEFSGTREDKMITKVEPAFGKYLGAFEGRVLTATK